MTVATLSIAEPRTRRWTREEYYRLAQEGYFRGQRVLLMEGEIIQMPPMGYLHQVSLVKVTRWLHELFNRDFVIRIQMPLNALEDSDPEPDAAVLPGPIETMKDHPQTALLVIEVSDSSLSLDRRKALLYAAAGVADYWIIDVNRRCIEVYRNPQPESQAPHGIRYAEPIMIKSGQSIAPLAIPAATVEPSQLLA